MTELRQEVAWSNAEGGGEFCYVNDGNVALTSFNSANRWRNHRHNARKQCLFHGDSVPFPMRTYTSVLEDFGSPLRHLGQFSMFPEPPADWQRFLPPGVESLSREKDNFEVIGPQSEYERAIATAKREAVAFARDEHQREIDEAKAEVERDYERRVAEFKRSGIEDVRRSDLCYAVKWATYLAVFGFTSIAWWSRRRSRIAPRFCWQCGVSLGAAQVITTQIAQPLLPSQPN